MRPRSEATLRTPNGAAAKHLGIAAVSVMSAWVWALSVHATTGALQGAPHVALYFLCVIVVVSANVDGPSPLGIAAGALLVASSIWDVVWHLTPSTEQELLLTPPHALLAGATCLALLRWQARSGDLPPRSARTSGIVSDALLVLWLALMANEFIGRPNLWHGSEFYLLTATLFPALLVVASRRALFGATYASMLYLVFLTGGYGLSALASAISPSTNDSASTVFVHFPILLIAPALVIDSVSLKIPRSLTIGKGWSFALLMGVSFVVTTFLCHWPIADMLLDHMDSDLLARLWPADLASAPWRSEYWTLDPSTRDLAFALVVASLLATASASLGLLYGEYLQQPGRSEGTS